MCADTELSKYMFSFPLFFQPTEPHSFPFPSQIRSTEFIFTYTPQKGGQKPGKASIPV